MPRGILLLFYRQLEEQVPGKSEDHLPWKLSWNFDIFAEVVFSKFVSILHSLKVSQICWSYNFVMSLCLVLDTATISGTYNYLAEWDNLEYFLVLFKIIMWNNFSACPCQGLADMEYCQVVTEDFVQLGKDLWKSVIFGCGRWFSEGFPHILYYFHLHILAIVLISKKVCMRCGWVGLVG